MWCPPIRRGGALRHPDRSAPRLGLRFAVGVQHIPAGITCVDARGVTPSDYLDQNGQNAPRRDSRSSLRDCELFSHGLFD